MTIKAIIFDLGGVIIELDFSSFYNKIISISPLENPHTRRTSIMLEFFRQSDLYHQGKMSDKEFYDLACDLLQVCMLDQHDFFEAFNSIVSYPLLEITELLKDLKKLDKYKIIALSNVNSSHWNYILRKNWDFLKYIDDFILSHEVKMTKPDPKLFQLAIQRTGCNPEEILYIDDGINNVRSAKELGLNAIIFNTKEDLMEEFKKFGIELNSH